jgi:transposase InsO family protein
VNVYPFIEAERAEQRHVNRACELLEVSRAAFYQWAKHVPSDRERADQALAPRINQIHQASRGTYGAPRVHAALRRDGVATSTKRVARLMRQQGLAGRRRRRFKRTTIADPTAAAAADLIKRAFGLGTTVIDRYWSGLIFHSDRGSQYTSGPFRDLLGHHEMRQSLAAPGQCWDNAVAESFFSTLKEELVHRHPWPTRARARQAIFEFVEVFYNRQRLHSSLGYLTPAEYEARGSGQEGRVDAA